MRLGGRRADQLDQCDDAAQRRHSGGHGAACGAGAAAGWAIGGLFQLGETLTRALEGLLILTALTGLFYFLRAAVAARADSRLAGRALAAKIAFPDCRRGAHSAKRAPGRFRRNADRPG